MSAIVFSQKTNFTRKWSTSRLSISRSRSYFILYWKWPPFKAYLSLAAIVSTPLLLECSHYRLYLRSERCACDKWVQRKIAPVWAEQTRQLSLLTFRETQQDPHLLNVRDFNSLWYSKFNKSHPTKIIIHGFGGGRDLAPSTNLRDGKMNAFLDI